MRDIILNFPKQFEIGLEKASGIKAEGNFNKILICGMGGSALPADFLTAYLNNIQIPVFTHRAYGLPHQADKNTLIFTISYSGNTEETISAFEQAVKNKFKVIVITTGGRLKELAEENSQPLVLIPQDAVQPRFSLGYLSAAFIKVLINCGLIEDKTQEIINTALKIEPLVFEEQGKTLAQRLMEKIPVIYASNRFKALAKIWKIKLNENSKIMAFWNYFPELNHNEMVGLTNLKGNFYFLILKDENDSLKTLKRMHLTADLILEKDSRVDILTLEGKNTLEKIINNLLLADWTSYYLALQYNEDPISVRIVEDFKKRLTE